MSFKKDKIDKIKIATLNVEGLDEENCRETLNRLNRRNFDVINLQNINLNKPNRDFAKEHYWRYDSIWTSNTAILAGNENIQFNDTEEFENGITTIVKYYKMTLQITNIYISSLIDGLKLCKQWMPYRSENIINVIVCESEEISLHLIYNEENEEIPGFTNVVDILGERFIQGAQDNSFPDCIYIDNDYTHFCKKIEVFYDEFSKPLVVCTLESFIWKLKKQMLEDPKVVYDITKEITSVNTVYEWDQLKNQFQSVFRSSKLNFFEEPKKELMSFDDIDSSDGDFDSLDQTLQNELIKGGWAKKNENATSVVRDPSAPDSKDPTEIFIYIKTYYQKLFKKDDFDIDIASEITDDLPHVNEEENNSLTDEITCEEISKTIARLDNEKDPGIDGLPFEFYKKFQKKLTPILRKIFNHILRTGEFPPSWLKSVIILIQKKGDLSDIGNWRPIALINCDAKIFTKIMTSRLNVICQRLIGKHQYGFVAGRYNYDAALNVISTMRRSNDQMKQAWLLFIDQKKAFDRVNHKFLLLTLKKMRFNGVFINLIKKLFDDQSAHISDRGVLSQPFKIERGVRQGDPLSPLLYVLAFEPFLRLLVKNLEGVEINGYRFKVSAFADDLTIGLGCSRDWYLVCQLLEKYEKASNAEVNKKKSVLVALTDDASRTKLAGDENYQKLKDNETTKYLGFSIDKKGQLEENYWDKVAENIKKTMQDIDQNELSSEDKMCIVTIAKSHLFSKIWYTAFLLPPNDEQIKLLSKLILEWVWNKLPPELINLEIPKLKNMVDARLGRIWLKLLTNNDLWANLERELIEKNLNEPITTALQQPAKLNDWPLEWMPYFRAWQRLNGKVLSTDSWPWNLNSIEIADLNADEYSIKSAVKYLENDNTQYVVI